MNATGAPRAGNEAPRWGEAEPGRAAVRRRARCGSSTVRRCRTVSGTSAPAGVTGEGTVRAERSGGTEQGER